MADTAGSDPRHLEPCGRRIREQISEHAARFHETTNPCGATTRTLTIFSPGRWVRPWERSSGWNPAYAGDANW